MIARSLALLTTVAFLVAVAGGGTQASSTTTVDLQVLAIAAFSGQVEPVNVSGIGTVGGAAALSAHFQAERSRNPNSLSLASANSFGATPPISNLFQDEPTVLSMNLMGIDADGLGNDNFDNGLTHLQRAIDLAQYPFLAANLRNLQGNLRGVEPFRIFEVAGVRIAVIGVISPDAPGRVFPGNFGSLEVTDPVAAARAARQQAEARGASVFVLITDMWVASTPNEAARGPLLDLAAGLSGFDVILGSQSGSESSRVINGALVIANQPRGLTYSRTRLTFDREANRVLAATNDFVTPRTEALQPDARIASLLASYRSQLATRLTQVIGYATSPITLRDTCGDPEGRSCESLVGNVVADAMRLAYGTDFALMNSGALRSDLTCPELDRPDDFCETFQPPPYPISAGQVQALLPFGNIAVRVTITGVELKAFLENAVSLMPTSAGRFPQVSGLCFEYDISRPAGARVTRAVRQAADHACTGPAIDFTAGARYTLTTNEFIAAGGDGYPAGRESDVLLERLDTVLTRYIGAASPLTPRLDGRIRCISSGTTPCPQSAFRPSAGFTGAIQPPATGDGGLR